MKLFMLCLLLWAAFFALFVAGYYHLVLIVGPLAGVASGVLFLRSVLRWVGRQLRHNRLQR